MRRSYWRDHRVPERTPQKAREGKGPLDSLPTPSVVEGSTSDPVPLKVHGPNHDTNLQEFASRQKFVVNGKEERPAFPERTEHSSRCFYSGKGCGQSPGGTTTVERGETQDLTICPDDG